MTNTALIQTFAKGSGGTDNLFVALPKTWKPNGTVRPVIYCHGRGGGAWANSPLLSSQNGQFAIVVALVEAGYPVIVSDLGGQNTWGYTPVTSRITSALSDAGTLFGAKTDKCYLVGTSMGALSALVYAAANPTSVACVVGVGPVVDLNDMVGNNRGGYGPEINGVYPGGYSNGTYGATYNPTVIAAAAGYGSLPIQLWYGASDAVVVPSTVTTFATNVGSSCTATSLAGGHAESTWGEVDMVSVVSFLQAHP